MCTVLQVTQGEQLLKPAKFTLFQGYLRVFRGYLRPKRMYRILNFQKKLKYMVMYGDLVKTYGVLRS